MKKNMYLLTLLCLVFFVIISGCSNSNESTSSKSEATEKDKKISTALPDVYGEISEVIGNEITLKLIEQPKRNENTTDDKESQTQGKGQKGGGGKREIKYTGTQKTITIPTGTPLITVVRENKEMKESQISINELQTGSMLSIYYQKDGKTIEKVKVQKPRTGGGRGDSTNN